jgi:hypothetical protein
MTTHLVIADQDTLDTITDNADWLATNWDSTDLYNMWHIETHDTWLFRTPGYCRAAFQVDGPERRDIDSIGRPYFVYLNPDDARPFLWRLGESLPLSDALKLLGVEEL